jgi:hypothetical protein
MRIRNPDYNGSEIFADPISYVIKSYGTPMKCTDIAPPRFQIGGRWYCLIAQRGLSECHQPLALPIAAVEIDHEEPEPWGLGRSIYSEAQLAAFAEFQQVAAVRAAYVADVSELAYSRRGPDGEWGLALGPRATEAIIDIVGLSFVVETRLRKISISSPVSSLSSGISAALVAAASGEDRERGPAGLYYYK